MIPPDLLERADDIRRLSGVICHIQQLNSPGTYDYVIGTDKLTQSGNAGTYEECRGFLDGIHLGLRLKADGIC